MNYWHMRLHPGDRDMTVEEIWSLIDKYKVIGMGKEWKNDRGQPDRFKNNMEVGDIVLIRHKGPLCLVEVTGKCFDNQDEDIWFGIARKVRLLEKYSDTIGNEFQEKTKENWSKGIYPSTTFESANKWDFIKFWHERYKAMNLLQTYSKLLKAKKNLILTGAPGTGKTYNTAALALSICGEAVPETHEDVMKRYEELRREGRIGFVTFHQSMDYEDFVEGIKPKTENGAITYEVEDGIFKALSDKARENYEDSQKTLEVLQKQKSIQDKISEFVTKAIENEMEFSTQIWYKFIITEITDKNIIVSITTEKHIATGEPIKNSTFTISLSKLTELLEREVSINEVSDVTRYFRRKNSSRQDYYMFYIVNEINKRETKIVDVPKAELQNYVLIIDEINRGNVSKIFGELITLLEADKRIGGAHPIKVTLPYSKEEFGVPSNLYIIGTMNTTDRSTGTIDYAVRRRFAFVTLPANREIIKDEKAQALFDDMEKFIKEHNACDMELDDLMVGHSYFMAKNDEELKLKMEYEVIPLINEYIKDGILSLKQDENKKIFFDAWKELQVVDVNKDNQDTEQAENNV